MSCASYIQVNTGPPARPRPRRSPLEDIDDHAALIGLQALTLNLATANRRLSGEPEPRKKCLKPLSISTARKSPEKHVSISPLSATPRSVTSSSPRSVTSSSPRSVTSSSPRSVTSSSPRSVTSSSPRSVTSSSSPRSAVSSSPRSRPSPSRSESSGFHSLPSPDSSSCSEASSGCCSQRGRLFTNHSNMEVKSSDSLESVNTRSSATGHPRQNNPRSRQGTPQSRQSTPQPRHGTPQPRQGTPQSRQGTPHSRQSTPQLRHGAQRDSQKSFDEYATIFDVQQGLKKGQLVEGVLRINPKSYKDAYISAPDGLTDIYVGGVRDRNRGLHGDVVAIQLRPPQEWKVSENALVTHLVSNGTAADLEALYGTEENLQKHAAKLGEILPQRFPRPLRFGSGQTERSADDVTVETAAAVVGAVPPAAGPAGQGGDSGDESDDVLVESVTLELAEVTAEAGQAAPTGSAQSDGQTAPTESPAQADDTGDAEKADNSAAARQAGDADQTDQEPVAEGGAQKPRRGNRGGRGKKRRPQESVAARLSRVTVPADELAALSLTEPPPGGVCDERRDRADAPAPGGPAAASAKPSCSSATNPGTAVAAAGQRAAPSAAAAVACDGMQDEQVDSVDGCTGDVAGTDADSTTDNGAADAATPSGKKRSRRPQKKNQTAQSAAGEASVAPGTPLTPGAPGTPGTAGTPNQRRQAGTPAGRQQRTADTQEEGSALGVTVERALKHAEWGRFVQRTAKVVHILEPKHPRRTVGELRQFPDGSRHQAMFAPRDHRVPRLKIAAADCPADFFQQPQLYARTLFMAEITDWTEPGFARGRLSQLLGDTGSIDVEMEAILLEYGVDTREFGPQDLTGLPTAPWSIPPEEIERRRDFRQECVFTIDPLTARDLDDAVSCRELDSGDFQVGVHIADVSFFLKPDVPADMTASQRCNSVYLVHKVIPMLPRVLCEDLCSLNPAKDRLAFSVVWTLDAEGRVYDEWFGRTVIRSCVKMAYEHAQRIIENPDQEPTEEELPPIDGGWGRSDIARRVLVLHRMSQGMRKRRTDDGALRLDQPKLCFQLDGPKGAPTGFYTYNQQDSNRLIEEFMLLANMAVAARILRSYPQLAVLRRHTPPQEGPLADAARMLRGAGLEIDVETSGSVHDSLQAMAARWQRELSPQEAIARMAVVVNLLSRPMNPAEYFCTGMLTEVAEYRHYALSVPLYTHFTSPIRRYPDVLVHRLLAAALKYDQPDKLPPQLVQRICVRCNEKKLSARLCSESCALLFLANMVDLCGPIRQPAVVMGVLDKSFDVFIPEMAISRRVYIDKLDVEIMDFSKLGGVPRLWLKWRATDTEPAVDQMLELFSPVTVSLEATDMPLKFNTVALRPGTAPPPEQDAPLTSAADRCCVPTAELDE